MREKRWERGGGSRARVITAANQSLVLSRGSLHPACTSLSDSPSASFQQRSPCSVHIWQHLLSSVLDSCFICFYKISIFQRWVHYKRPLSRCRIVHRQTVFVMSWLLSITKTSIFLHCKQGRQGKTDRKTKQLRHPKQSWCILLISL